jgi:hypothetical protein
MALSQAITHLTCIAQIESRLIDSCLKMFLISLGTLAENEAIKPQNKHRSLLSHHFHVITYYDSKIKCSQLELIY